MLTANKPLVGISPGEIPIRDTLSLFTARGNSKLGKVYLVGAGPGDPGLITVRGWELLRQADFVLYDGLVNPALLRVTQAHAERTCRLNGPDGRHLDQAEINRRLVAAGHEHQCVVRLKGGDPYIFGRGSEEAAALASAGIPFEVVPGVTAATAAAVYAGLSLTHRDHASAVAFITGHEDPRKPERTVDYQHLAEFPGTLVFYMGLHRLGSIADTLIAGGKPRTTPVAVISKATTPAQRVVTGCLADIASLAAAAGLHPPSLVVVGDCVTLREQARWFESLPLFGLRIGIARAEDQFDDVADKAWRLGAEPVSLPAIEIGPPHDWTAVDAACERLAEFHWLVFTSVNGVQGFFDRLWATGRDARALSSLKLAAIGPSTAAALAARSLRVDLQPDEYRAEALAAALAPHVAGRRVLWARASRGRDVLPERLYDAGADLEQLVVYRNDDIVAWPDDIEQRLIRGELDWLALSSPSIARRVAALLPPAARERLGVTLQIAAISPITAAAARDAGLPVHAIADVYTWDGLLAAIADSHAQRSQRLG